MFSVGENCPLPVSHESAPTRPQWHLPQTRLPMPRALSSAASIWDVHTTAAACRSTTPDPALELWRGFGYRFLWYGARASARAMVASHRPRDPAPPTLRKGRQEDKITLSTFNMPHYTRLQNFVKSF